MSLPDAAHVLVVLLDKTESTDQVATSLGNKLLSQGFELATWRELSDFYDKTIQLYDRQFGVLRLIILLMVLLSVANSVNMTLFERTREFGTLLDYSLFLVGGGNTGTGDDLCLVLSFQSTKFKIQQRTIRQFSHLESNTAGRSRCW